MLDDWGLIPSRDRDAYVFTIVSSLILGVPCVVLSKGKRRALSVLFKAVGT